MEWSLVWELFSYAIIAALLAGLTCPVVGSFLLVRRTGFYGITLPQFAACGLAFGYAVLPWWLETFGLAGLELDEVLHSPHAASNYAIAWSSAFTLGGMFVLLLLSKKKETETARVAAAFAIAASGTLMLSVASPVGRDKIETLLRGELLTVNFHELETIGVVYLTILVAIWIGYRKFLLVSYDSDMAAVLGVRTRRTEVLFMLLVGLTVSTGVLIVGPIVLFGLLVLPPLAAHSLARSMAQLISLSALIGVLSTMCGLYLSFDQDLPLGPSVCLAAGLVLVLCKLLARVRKS